MKLLSSPSESHRGGILTAETMNGSGQVYTAGVFILPVSACQAPLDGDITSASPILALDGSLSAILAAFHSVRCSNHRRFIAIQLSSHTATGYPGAVPVLRPFRHMLFLRLTRSAQAAVDTTGWHYSVFISRTQVCGTVQSRRSATSGVTLVARSILLGPSEIATRIHPCDWDFFDSILLNQFSLMIYYF